MAALQLNDVNPAVVEIHLPKELELFKDRLSPKFFDAREKVVAFIKEEILPAYPTYNKQKKELEATVASAPFAPAPPILNTLRQKAKARGLMNFFLPEVCGLTVLEYAPIAEILGRVPLANEAMNCAAPDTGNMEVLAQFGNAQQKQQWLEPLLEGKIRSAFAMTEPGVASSDATNVSAQIVRDGDDYVINGHKWYISGACRPECKVFVFLGVTNPEAAMHAQHSMILVPRDAPGVKIIRAMGVFGHIHDHAEIIFDNVRVPKANLLVGEGKGFFIAQGRLGPGRIHHCMRSIGVAEAALDAMLYRVQRRTVFGHEMAKKDIVRQAIAEARIDITKSRMLCYLAAHEADTKGFKAAKHLVSMIKVDAPRTCLKVLDEAMQVHGAHGVSQDSLLSEMYANVRTLRLADGPDVVHQILIAREELKREPSAIGRMVSGTNPNIEKYGKYKDMPLRRGWNGKMQARL